MDYAYQGHHPLSQLTAMVASHQSSGASPRYTDTGATDNITSDINNLTVRSDYHGSDKVLVGNGAGLFSTIRSHHLRPQQSQCTIRLSQCFYFIFHT